MTSLSVLAPRVTAAWTVLAVCASAWAGIEPRGDPIEGGSWGQGFEYTVRREPIDLMAVALLSGGPFEAPAFRALDAVAWSSLLEGPDLAAAGTYTNPETALSFELWFEGEPEAPISFLFGAWHPGESLAFEGYRLTWDGQERCVWVVSPNPWTLPRPVPAPGAAALGVLGLAVLGWLKGTWRTCESS